MEQEKELEQERETTLAMLDRLRENFKHLPPLSTSEEDKALTKPKKHSKSNKQENKL